MNVQPPPAPPTRRLADNLDEFLHLREYAATEVTALLALEDASDVARLFRRADEIRQACVGGTVHLRGIIEISNHCERSCAYCGLRRWNTAVQRYRMEVADIVDVAVAMTALPVRTIVLQSGESSAHSAREIEAAIEGIRARTDAAITLSLGERSEAVYERWFAAGADRYLLKHETANPSLFRALKPDADFLHRIACLRTLKRLGYQIGTGNMIGLPGQTLADIADDILLCRDLDADMCTFGPFISSPETPLAHAPNGGTSLALKAIATARIVLRDVHIPANTALSTLDPSARSRALHCGANVIMPNFTPPALRRHYRIYPSADRPTYDSIDRYREICSLIEAAGLAVDGGPGHSLKRGKETATAPAHPGMQ